jgi:hypothetical protein
VVTLPNEAVHGLFTRTFFKLGIYGSGPASLLRAVWPPVVLLVCLGCTPVLDALPADSGRKVLCESAGIVMGRVTTELTGQTTRPFMPELRFFELVEVISGNRTRVNVGTSDTHFVVPLPPGEYALGRVQISEGAFQALADIGARFSLLDGTLTDLGTWNLGVESPQYDRTLSFSNINERSHVQTALNSYPCLRGRSYVSASTVPGAIETRLYETAPYPRFWWFRRHHTS